MTRREFVGGLGAAALAAGCRSVPTGKRPVRVVIWGITHEHATGKLWSIGDMKDEYELVGVVDDRDTKTPCAFKLRPEFWEGIPRLTPEQVFADKSIDCVFVETTNDDLVPTAWKIAEHGRPMHLDKPGGQSLGPYVELMNYCEKRKIPVQMGYMYRVNPAIKFAEKAVKAGWLGELCSVEADMFHNYGGKMYADYIATFKGGVLYNLGCHLVDSILPMFGDEEPVAVHPVMLSAPGDRADAMTNCVSVLEYPHATATIRSCSQCAEAGSRRQMRINGTKGAIQICPIERFDGKPLTLEMRLEMDVPGYKAGTHIVDVGIQKDRFAEQLREFAEIVRGERPNPAGQYAHDIAVHRTTLRACGMMSSEL